MAVVEHVVVTPTWIKVLVDDVLLDAVAPYGFIGPLGYRYTGPGESGNSFDGWTLFVYPVPSEIRGADQLDGAQFVSGFELDISRIIRNMAAIEEVVWRAPAKYNRELDGPEISVRGRFAEKRVWIRFFNLPPSDEPPAFAVDPATGVATALPA